METRARKIENGSSLGAGQSLHLNMIIISRIGRQGLVRSQSPRPNSLSNKSVGGHHNDNNKHNVNHEHQIQNGHSPEPRLIKVALGGSLDPTHNIQQLMTPFGYKRINVKREPSLQHPEPLQANRRPQTHLRHKELRVTCQNQTHYGSHGRYAGRNGIAFRLEIRRLNIRSGFGNGVMEKEQSGPKGEEEIRRERKKRCGFGDEKRKGNNKEEEQNGGGVEREEAVNGGAAFDERVGVGGDEGLVEESDEEAKQKEIKREVFEAEIGGERERVKGLGGVALWGFKEVNGGADEVVKTQREKRGGG
ncbi:hypothetical protein V6N13_086704 [Hibiscus sabdariffa]|uniref:Uncharacterized protein n=1 Tax=Hibiscus sabdariffa TaxID=183260 RepID=A0ABR2FU97_9ROSI